jgi:hypothetical protein
MAAALAITATGRPARGRAREAGRLAPVRADGHPVRNQGPAADDRPEATREAVLRGKVDGLRAEEMVVAVVVARGRPEAAETRAAMHDAVRPQNR